MKLTNEQIDQSLNIMGLVREKHELGFAIMKNTRILIDAGREYIELKQRLLEQYGKTGQDGLKHLSSLTDPEAFESYKEEMGDIPKIEVEVNVVTVDEKTFTSGNLDNFQMNILSWMLRKEGEEE